MNAKTLTALYSTSVRLLGYGIIAVGLGASLYTYLKMLVRLDEAEPDKAWELLKHQ